MLPPLPKFCTIRIRIRIGKEIKRGSEGEREKERHTQNYSIHYRGQEWRQ
jgi:hypothetical protein